MKRSLKTGFSFGLTSGVITTLGLMVGLYSSTNSKLVVIGGIITIAIADSFSDSIGIHIAQESQNHISKNEIWEATIYTFIGKFIFSSIFLIPILLFNLKVAIMLSILIGFYLIIMLSLIIARDRKEGCCKVIIEHVLISIVIIILTYFIGSFIHSTFL